MLLFFGRGREGGVVRQFKAYLCIFLQLSLKSLSGPFQSPACPRELLPPWSASGFNSSSTDTFPFLTQTRLQTFWQFSPLSDWNVCEHLISAQQFSQWVPEASLSRRRCCILLLMLFVNSLCEQTVFSHCKSILVSQVFYFCFKLLNTTEFLLFISQFSYSTIWWRKFSFTLNVKLEFSHFSVVTWPDLTNPCTCIPWCLISWQCVKHVVFQANKIWTRLACITAVSHRRVIT